MSSFPRSVICNELMGSKVCLIPLEKLWKKNGERNKKNMSKVYIVLTGIEHGEGSFNKYIHIDSVWTSKRKADKRCDELNADTDTLEEFGYLGYAVEEQLTRK